MALFVLRSGLIWQIELSEHGILDEPGKHRSPDTQIINQASGDEQIAYDTTAKAGRVKGLQGRVDEPEQRLTISEKQ